MFEELPKLYEHKNFEAPISNDGSKRTPSPPSPTAGPNATSS